MAGAASKGDYSGAAVIFAAGAIFSTLMVLGFPSSGARSIEALLRASTDIGAAGVSAAVASLLLRPMARRLAAHQYFLRPVIMGCSVVILAHVLFGLIAAPLSEIGSALTKEHYRFESQSLLARIYLLSFGGFIFTCSITVPVGILAAYCVEIVGWFRKDARNRAGMQPANSKH